MNNIFNLAILPFLISAGVSYTVTPLVIKIAHKIGIIDDPKTHKHPKVIHTYPTPRGGGLAIFSGILVASLIFLPLDKHLFGILLGGTILTILGIVDDKLDLNPHKRLIIQFLIAGIPIAAGIGIAYIRLPYLVDLIQKVPFLETSFVTNPVNGSLDLSYPRFAFTLFGAQHSIWLFSDLFALFWMVALMNFINIGASGLDGQLSGTVVIASMTIAALSLRYSADITQWPVIILAVTTAGSYFGFLPWHIYPQKIMPGFGGSTLAGFMLGVLSILSTTKVGTLMVVLAVPLIDTIYAFVRRIASGKSPFWGDRGHLHHKLLDAGFSKKQVAFFYWSVTTILGLIALNLNASFKFYTILGVAILLAGVSLWLTRTKIS